jgi:hypothetical protein
MRWPSRDLYGLAPARKREREQKPKPASFSIAPESTTAFSGSFI